MATARDAGQEGASAATALLGVYPPLRPEVPSLRQRLQDAAREQGHAEGGLSSCARQHRPKDGPPSGVCDYLWRMRRDLEDCGRAIYEKGFPWGMVTNALHLTPQRWQGLLKAGIHSMAISLDGLEDDHNWMRGNEQSFQMVSQAIDMLAATEGFVFDIVTCVNRRNYTKLDDIKEFLISKGVKRWRIFTVFPVGRATLDPMMRLTDEEFRGVFEYIKRTRKEGRIRVDYGCEGFLGNYEGEVRNRLFSCQAGVTVGSVMADGSIAACASIRADYNQGNIYEDDFMDVWENRYHPYRNRDWMKTGECASCKYFRYCRGNGMHLRDGNGNLLLCNLKRLQEF